MTKRSTFRRRQHHVRPDLRHQARSQAWHAERRAERRKAALKKPGAKVAMSEVWGAADCYRTRKLERRRAAWTGAVG